MIPTAPWTISTLMYKKCPASGGNKNSAFDLENQSSLILFVYNFRSRYIEQNICCTYYIVQILNNLDMKIIA